MRKTLSTFAILALAVFVSACAGSFKSDVTRFHQLTQPAGETFVVAAMNPAHQGSLEFNQYAADVASRLVALGYHPATGTAPADLTVRLGYTIDEGRTAITSYPSTRMSMWSGYGWRSPYWSPYYGGYWGSPWGGYPGFDYPEIRSYVVYTRKLAMDIERNGADGKPQQRLFEGRVESQGRDNRMTAVMPYMISAMFDNFPGSSGITTTVKIPYENSGK